jgi:protein-S-isoprenylcysteine O-methyltransferase
LDVQVLLANPVCIIGFACASWLFFRDRIEEEEEYLMGFFGQDYADYQERVGTGIPFVRGFRPEPLKSQ